MGEVSGASQPEIIYGQDNRQNANELRPNPLLWFDASCVLVLVTTDDLISIDKTVEELKTKEFGPANNLCPEVKFRDQFCVRGYAATGFLVGEDVVATSASNLKGKDIRRLRFIAGFDIPVPLDRKYIFSSRMIYEIGDVLWLDEDRGGALVQLISKVVAPSLPRLRYSGTVPDSSRLHMIGHPNGLPKKYAPGA